MMPIIVNEWLIGQNMNDLQILWYHNLRQPALGEARRGESETE